MKKTIEIIDERGMYQFSKMYLVRGEDLDIEELGESTLSGAPEVVDIWVTEPYGIFNNPAMPIKPDKNYRIVIIEVEDT